MKLSLSKYMKYHLRFSLGRECKPVSSGYSSLCRMSDAFRCVSSIRYRSCTCRHSLASVEPMPEARDLFFLHQRGTDKTKSILCQLSFSFEKCMVYHGAWRMYYSLKGRGFGGGGRGGNTHV